LLNTSKTKYRKVIKCGDNLIITLPKEFVERSGIKRGQKIACTYDSILIAVIPNLPPQQKEGDS